MSKKNKQNNPGKPVMSRRMLPFDTGIPLEQGMHVRIQDYSGAAIDSVYLGESKKKVRPFERFSVMEQHVFPINSMVEVHQGRKNIGRFMVANYRHLEKTILLVKEENLPCVD